MENQAEGRKLFVGSLSWNLSDDDLRKAFEEIGPVDEAVIIRDRQRDNRSKGFGFVTMTNQDDVQKAIDKWHEQEMDGRKVIVNVARPREDRPAM